MTAPVGAPGPSLKYAVVETERRWLLSAVPPDLGDDVLQVRDHYVTGTRLRLRETVAGDGTVVRKLGHKVRLGDGPERVACTSVRLDDAEWALLRGLPGRALVKTRHRLPLGDRTVAVDEFAGHLAGLVLAEVDGGDGPAPALPPTPGWRVLAEVTADERYTGGALAAAPAPPQRREA